MLVELADRSQDELVGRAAEEQLALSRGDAGDERPIQLDVRPARRLFRAEQRGQVADPAEQAGERHLPQRHLLQRLHQARGRGRRLDDDGVAKGSVGQPGVEPRATARPAARRPERAETRSTSPGPPARMRETWWSCGGVVQAPCRLVRRSLIGSPGCDSRKGCAGRTDEAQSRRGRAGQRTVSGLRGGA